jgi:hypothetical protein
MARRRVVVYGVLGERLDGSIDVARVDVVGEVLLRSCSRLAS